jgi:hypothetical protein
LFLSGRGFNLFLKTNSKSQQPVVALLFENEIYPFKKLAVSSGKDEFINTPEPNSNPAGVERRGKI